MTSKESKRAMTCHVFIVALLSVSLALLSGCGGGEKNAPVPTDPHGLKLPPGVVEKGGLSGDVPPTRTTVDTDERVVGVEEELEVGGGRFTLMAFSRRRDNSSVAGPSIRETNGDYLEIELAVENVSDDFLDLSEFEFRLWSPALDTGDYSRNYPLGRPVGDNLIAVPLLARDDLSPVTFSIKIGERLDDCLLFYDLNPRSVHRNTDFDPAVATFGVCKSRGKRSGEKAEISLEGLLREE